MSGERREWNGYAWEFDSLFPVTIYWDEYEKDGLKYLAVWDESSHDIRDDIEDPEDMKEWEFYDDLLAFPNGTMNIGDILDLIK